jgi:hypothetical protein
MRILKDGMELICIFKCRLCECEFEAEAKECSISYVAMAGVLLDTDVDGYKSECNCPCCGKPTITYDYKEKE